MKRIKAWISKDGDKIENMSFFPTKEDAIRFQRMTGGRDVVISCEISYSLPTLKGNKKKNGKTN